MIEAECLLLRHFDDHCEPNLLQRDYSRSMRSADAEIQLLLWTTATRGQLPPIELEISKECSECALKTLYGLIIYARQTPYVANNLSSLFPQYRSTFQLTLPFSAVRDRSRLTASLSDVACALAPCDLTCNFPPASRFATTHQTQHHHTIHLQRRCPTPIAAGCHLRQRRR